MATVAHAPGLAVVGTDKQPTTAAAAAEASLNGDTTAGLELTPALNNESAAGSGANGRRALSVSTPEKAMSEELKE